MAFYRLGKTAAAGLLAIAFLASGPVGAQRLQVEAGKWNVDYGNVRCSLARRLGGPQSPIVILTSYLGRDEPEIIMMDDGEESLPDLPSRIDVVVSPSGHVSTGVVRSRRVRAGRVVSVQELGGGFIDRFATAEAVHIQAAGRRLAELRTPGAGAAVAALRACNEDLLRSWGIDPNVRLAQAARQVGGSISDRDYPSALIAAGEKGAVVARFTINAQGEVTNCGAVVSSGFPRLDALTCELITQRFQYEPALDENGRPTPSMTVRTVNWMNPD